VSMRKPGWHGHAFCVAMHVDSLPMPTPNRVGMPPAPCHPERSAAESKGLAVMPLIHNKPPALSLFAVGPLRGGGMPPATAKFAQANEDGFDPQSAIPGRRGDCNPWSPW